MKTLIILYVLIDIQLLRSKTEVVVNLNTVTNHLRGFEVVSQIIIDRYNYPFLRQYSKKPNHRASGGLQFRYNKQINYHPQSENTYLTISYFYHMYYRYF